MNHRQTKYRSKRTEYNGIVYDSKAEATHAALLDRLRKARDPKERVVEVLRQVRFYLPGNITYRLDFAVSYTDGHEEYHEVKGFETPGWKMKMKLMKQMYPGMDIKIIK